MCGSEMLSEPWLLVDVTSKSIMLLLIIYTGATCILKSGLL